MANEYTDVTSILEAVKAGKLLPTKAAGLIVQLRTAQELSWAFVPQGHVFKNKAGEMSRPTRADRWQLLGFSFPNPSFTFEQWDTLFGLQTSLIEAAKDTKAHLI